MPHNVSGLKQRRGYGFAVIWQWSMRFVEPVHLSHCLLVGSQVQGIPLFVTLIMVAALLAWLRVIQDVDTGKQLSPAVATQQVKTCLGLDA